MGLQTWLRGYMNTWEVPSAPDRCLAVVEEGSLVQVEVREARLTASKTYPYASWLLSPIVHIHNHRVHAAYVHVISDSLCFFSHLLIR